MLGRPTQPIHSQQYRKQLEGIMDGEKTLRGEMEEDAEPDNIIGVAEEEDEHPNAESHQTGRSSFLHYIRTLGILWAFFNAAGIAAHMVFVVYLSGVVHPIQALFIRTCFLLVLALSSFRDSGAKYDPNELLANFFFGILDYVGVGAGYLMIAHLYAAETFAIIMNQPILAATMARVYLGGQFHPSDGVLAVINVLGLVVVSETGTNFSIETATGFPVRGVVKLTLFGILSLAVAYSAARLLSYRKREDRDPSLFYVVSGIVGVSLSSMYLTATSSWQVPYTTYGVTLSALLGITAVFEYYAFTTASRTQNVLIVAAIKTLAIPVTYICAISVTGALAGWQTVIGVGLTAMTSSLICFHPYFVPRGDEKRQCLDPGGMTGRGYRLPA